MLEKAFIFNIEEIVLKYRLIFCILYDKLGIYSTQTKDETQYIEIGGGLCLRLKKEMV